MRLVGVDFGTTNSVVAVLDEGGTMLSRSILCFWLEPFGASHRFHYAAGSEAVRAYLEDPLDSRLILSMKTFLAQKSFESTRIFGRIYTLEQLVATFLRELLPAIGDGAAVIAGRPVRFAGERPDDALGEKRLRAAFADASLPVMDVVLEPEAAGWHFMRTISRPTTVLIGDFGGGTSDFSVLRFTPGRGIAALGHAGIGIAGDVFDYRIIDRVIAPRLGKGDTYTIMGKELPVPPEYFNNFARWHRLSMMRTPRTLREIGSVARTAAHPERLQALIRLIEGEHGYRLYEAVAAAKMALSHHEQTVLRFREAGLAIEAPITRAEFENWIAEDLSRIGSTVDAALEAAAIKPKDIDRVFLTGGTSFVPAVRVLFLRRFGPDRVSAGDEFVSVAEGLALAGLDRIKAD
jgi:hypothetical chaperone protein